MNSYTYSNDIITSNCFQSTEILADFINDTEKIVDKLTEKQTLIEAKVKHESIFVPSFGVDIKLLLVDGQIAGLDIKAAMGFVQQGISVDDLKRGKPLKFYFQGSDEPSLIIKPGTGFNELGGEAEFQVRVGSHLHTEKVKIQKDAKGKFEALLKKAERYESIRELTININGNLVNNTNVTSYSINNQSKK